MSRRLFDFTVKRLRWLAKVPGLPQFFDALLVTHTALWHRERLLAMEAVERKVLKIPGATLQVHRFGGVAFVLNGRELAHLHGNGLLDVHLGRTVARKCVENGHAEPHHVLGDSAWVSFWIRSQEDVPRAVDLILSGGSLHGT